LVLNNIPYIFIFQWLWANYSFHTGGDKAPRSKVDQGNNAN